MTSLIQTPRRLATWLFIAATLVSSVHSENAPTPSAPGLGTWTPLIDAVNAVTEVPVTKGAVRMGLAVDRSTGNLLISQWNSGGILQSSDQGKTFVRSNAPQGFGGGPFSAYSLVADPAGGKFAAFTCNSPFSLCSVDGGKVWTQMAHVPRVRGWDFGAVAWESKSILALSHETKTIGLSTDLGQTWTVLELDRNDFSGAGIFESKELLLSGTGGIQRSTDDGKNWTTVSDHSCMGVMQLFEGAAYWTCNVQRGEEFSAVVVSSVDHGLTWTELGKPLEKTLFTSNPCFGKNSKHLVVTTLDGIMESLDGGANWKLVTAWPAEAFKPRFSKSSPGYPRNGLAFPGFGYDAARDTFYVSLFGSKNGALEFQVWKYQR